MNTASISVVLTNGDSAEAATPEDALYAAGVLMREATALSGSYYTARVTASFYGPDGKLIRAGVTSSDLVITAKGL